MHIMEVKMEKTSTNKKQKLTKSQFQKKTFKFLFIAYLVVIVVWAIISNYITDKKTIYDKIGTMAPSSISIKDALNIKGYGVLPYIDFIKAGDTKSAYDMLTEEYRKAFSYEEYLKTLEGIDFETFDMKEIKIKAENTYIATMVYEKAGEKTETDYLLYLNHINPKIITISPNKFIYSYNGLKFKMNNIELTLQNCNIYTDNIKITALIKNTSLFDKMEFTNVGVGYGESINKAQDINFTIEPGETKEIEIEYDTNYYIPNNIKIKRMIDKDTVRTYTFYFEDTK